MTQPTWSTLSAYVDGELDAAAAAAVADAAGRDAAVADQIALLYQLKGVSHGVAPEAPTGLKSLLPKPRRVWPAAVAAAAAALVLLTTAVWLSLSTARAPAMPPEVFDVARTLHTEWLNADAARPKELPSTVLLAALSQFGEVPVVPDLESTELAVGLVSVADGPKGRLLQIGYRGTHGCHLSLFVFADDGMPHSVVRVAAGLDRAYGWQANNLGYLLFARGMDESRLALIAEKVEQATRARAPLGNLARQELAENKRHSASCHA